MKASRLTVMAFVTLAFGQCIYGQSTTQPADLPEIVKLTLHPMATTRPALMYHLLPDMTEQTPGNAASLYFLGQSIWSGDKKEFEDKVFALGDVPLSQLPLADADKLIEQGAARLRYAHLAARCEDVKWDVALRQQGIYALLPYLNDMRVLWQLVDLKARVAISRKDWRTAIEALQDGFSMSRQLGEGSMLLPALVGGGIENYAIDRVQDWVVQPGAPNLYWAISDLPQPCVDLGRCMQMEQAMIEYTFPNLAAAQKGDASPEQCRAILEQAARIVERSQNPNQPEMGPTELHLHVVGLVATVYSRAKDQLILSGLTKEKVDSMVAIQVVTAFFVLQYREFSDEAFKGWELPYWPGGEAMQRLEAANQIELNQEKEKTGNPFLDLVPSLNHVRIIFVRIDRRIAILRTIEMLRDYTARHDGRLPERLDQITDLPVPIDPVTGKLFNYELKGQTAVIEAPALPDHPRRTGKTYVLTFEK